MLEDGLQTQKLHFDFPGGSGFYNPSTKCLPHRVCGEVFDLEPVLHLNLLEMGVYALNGIHSSFLADEAGLLPVGYLQSIVAVLDMPLEALVDFDDASLAGLLFVNHKAVSVQKH